MNQTGLKSARMTSCSTKKSTKNSCKSANNHKKNLENTLVKMNNPTLTLINGNNSILTQRNNTHSKCKGISSNPETEITARLKESTKKSTKAINKMKTDRKAEYTKLKAQQIENEISRKNSSNTKVTKKSILNDFNVPLNENKLNAHETNRIHISNNISKISSFLSEGTQQISEIKKNSDSFVLSEIEKNQRQLLEKIALLEKENSSLSQKQEKKFNEIKYSHDSEVNVLREEMRILHLKLNQQGNNNQVLEKKVQSNENEYRSLREKIQEKEICIENLDNENKRLSEELYSSRNIIKGCESKINNLESHIEELKLEKKHLSEQLAKHKQEKFYIKENCVQVLELLREEFGQEFKLFSD